MSELDDVELETRCDHYNCDDSCRRCGGTGYITSDFGDKVLILVGRNLKFMLGDMKAEIAELKDEVKRLEKAIRAAESEGD